MNNKITDFHDTFSSTSSVSDKIHYHGYQRIYPWFLHHLINKEPSILEIGFSQGESISLWKEYFKNPIIHICDINKHNINKHNNEYNVFKFHLLDQSKISDWINFRNTNMDLKFDFIIDDGSHVPEHQILTLNNVWPMLNDGGIYIIEDIETSYWNQSTSYGYNFDSKKTSVFKSLIGIIDIINKKISSIPKASSPISKKMINTNFKYGDEVEIIAFGYNSIILIKKDKKYVTYYKKEYTLALKVNEYGKSNTLTKKIGRIIKKIGFK